MGTLSCSRGSDTAAQTDIPAPRRQPGSDPSRYQSPDDEHPSVREPQPADSISAGLPASRPRNHHAAADPRQRGAPASNGSLNDLVSKERDTRSVGIRDRIACFQWTWFTMTMVRVSLPWCGSLRCLQFRVYRSRSAIYPRHTVFLPCKSWRLVKVLTTFAGHWRNRECLRCQYVSPGI